MMDAKRRNASHRSLFLNGGRLDILLWGYRELERAAAEMKEEREATAQFSALAEIVGECPCGCGLKNDICETRQAAAKAADDEIPF